MMSEGGVIPADGRKNWVAGEDSELRRAGFRERVWHKSRYFLPLHIILLKAQVLRKESLLVQVLSGHLGCALEGEGVEMYPTGKSRNIRQMSGCGNSAEILFYAPLANHVKDNVIQREAQLFTCETERGRE